MKVIIISAFAGSDLQAQNNATTGPEAVEQNTTYAKLVAWASSDIPQPPYLFGIAKSYLYFRLRAIGGTNPPDPVPDPAITWTGMGPATLTITRYSSGPFGAWDQVTFIPGMVKFGNLTTNRPTQTFSNLAVSADPSFPTHWATTLADFQWTKRLDGREDLRLFTPNTAQLLATFRGLYILPFLAIPVPNTTLYIPPNILSEVNSVVSAYDGVSPVTGHVINFLSIQGTASVATLEGYEVKEGPLSAGDPFLPIGAAVLNGSFWGISATPVS